MNFFKTYILFIAANFICCIVNGQTVVIPQGATWSYYDQGMLPASNWNSALFNSSSWSNGSTKLGYGDPDIATNVSFGSDPNNKYTTTYFRKNFNLTTVSDLIANIQYDDGAVVYVNGNEVFRGNMPIGTINYNTFATTFVSQQDEATWHSFTINSAILNSGNNVIAVEVHQSDLVSSDKGFDFTLTTVPPVATLGIYFNEVMSANVNTINDNLGNNEDWFEIRNSTNAVVNLLNYYVSDKLSQPTKHKLQGSSSEFQISANGYLLLWASGNPNNGAKHTNFSLSSSGETIYLFAPDGATLIDSLQFPELQDDISFGNENNNDGIERFFIGGTPNASNAGQSSYLGITPKPMFSNPAGYYNSNFNLSLSTVSGSSVYYSLDGTDPYIENATGINYNYKNRYPTNSGDPIFPMESKTITSNLYVSPIAIYNNSNDLNNVARMASTWNKNYPAPYMPGSPNPLVNNQKCRVVKARAYRPGYIPSEVVTNTYFVNSGGQNQYNLAVISLSTDERNLFQYDAGLFTPGKPYYDWWQNWAVPNGFNQFWQWTFLLDNPQVSQRKPITMELFEGQQSARQVHINTAFEIKGSISTTSPKRTMALYFRDVYGKSNLGYPIFQESGNDKTDIKDLLIRSCSNDDTRIIDMTNQAIVNHMRFETQDDVPSILFINGEYWGLYDVKERYNENYFQLNYGLDENEIDLLNYKPFVTTDWNNYTHTDIEDYESVIGDRVHYDAMLSFIENNNISVQSNYDYVKTQMDVENFMDYYIANIFINNNDWPQNNDKAFRKRVPYTPLSPNGHDGRWRWIMSSTEGTHSNHTQDNVNRIHELLYPTETNHINATRIFRKLMSNQTFKEQFINRFADMINTAFSASYSSNVVQEYLNLLTPYMSEEVSRWKIANSQFQNTISDEDGWFFTLDYSSWLTRANGRKNFFNTRPQNCRNHIESSLSAGTQRDLTLNVSGFSHGFIHVNTIDITSETRGVSSNPYPWTGKYFRDVKITLTAVAKPGYVFSHWQTNSLHNNSTNPVINEFVQTAFNSVTAIFIPDASQLCQSETLYSWNFNSIPGGNLMSIASNVAYAEQGLLSLIGTGNSSMHQTTNTQGTIVNALGGDLAEGGLEINNPTENNSLKLKIPTIGKGKLKLSLALKRSLNGPELFSVFYCTNQNQDNWIQVNTTIVPENEFATETYEINDPLAFDNEYFGIKLEFTGPSANGDDGNIRIDNLRLNGVSLNITETAICAGGSFLFFGNNYSTEGKYLHTSANSDGCDSLSLLNLTVLTPLSFIPELNGVTFSVPNFDNAIYSWQSCPGGSAIPGATSNEFTPLVPGDFSATVQVNGCTFTSTCVDYNVGLELISESDHEITYFPNPTSDILHVKVGNHYLEQMLTILDISGKEYLTKKIKELETQISLKNLARGSYLLKIGETNVFKILKE